MMGTYELVIAFLQSKSLVPPSTTVEVTTIQTRKVVLQRVDFEANAVNEAEL